MIFSFIMVLYQNMMIPIVQLLNQSSVSSEIFVIETTLPLFFNIASVLFHFETALLYITV